MDMRHAPETGKEGRDMAASYAKPDEQRVTRTPQKHGWTDLPERRDGPVPELPSWRIWMPATLEWWSQLWAKPEATQWAQDGSTLFTLAALYDDLFAGRCEAAKVSAEMRQHEDRHGLNPKAKLQLLWRVVGDQPEAPAPRAASKGRDRRKAALAVIEGG